jgi:hypothetical protein
MNRDPPLADGASAGSAEVVQLLVDRGADVRLPADTDRVLLRHAVDTPAVLRILLDAGIDLAGAANDTTTGAMALQWAAEEPEPRSVQMLIDAGVRDRKSLDVAYQMTVATIRIPTRSSASSDFARSRSCSTPARIYRASTIAAGRSSPRPTTATSRS